MNIFSGYQKGINLGGWLSQCVSREKVHFDTFITEDDIKTIAGWGLDHVRLPFDYDIIETDDGVFKEDGLAYIDNCISWCKKYGLNLILDLHKTFGYTFDPLEKTDKEIFFHDETLQGHFIELWTRLAERYGKYSDFVAFELLNEIVSFHVVNEWNDIVKKTVTAIREIAPETYILFGGVNYNNVASVPSLIEPFADKLVYNFHCYDPLIFTHQKAYWVEGMPSDFEMKYPATIAEFREASLSVGQQAQGAIFDDNLDPDSTEIFEPLFAPAIKTAAERNVPLYCGEYGVIDQADPAFSLNWLNDIHAAFERHGIGRALWNYKNKDFGIMDEHYNDIRSEMIKIL